MDGFTATPNEFPRQPLRTHGTLSNPNSVTFSEAPTKPGAVSADTMGNTIQLRAETPWPQSYWART